MALRWRFAAHLAAVAIVSQVHLRAVCADEYAGVADQAPAPPPVGHWFDPQRNFYEGRTVVVTMDDWYPQNVDGQAPPNELFSLEHDGSGWVAVEHRPSLVDRRFNFLPVAEGQLMVSVKVNGSSIKWRLWKVPEAAPNPEPQQISDEQPGPIHFGLAGILGAALLAGLFRVVRVLRALDSTTAGLRDVPEGMETAECGGCHRMQYISVSGRIFICFDCHAANRIPRDLQFRRDLHQPLVTPTGPLHRFEFRKGGDNYWQELKREALPMLEQPAPSERDSQPIEAGKLHYRGTFCLACEQQLCARLAEFPTAESVVAYLPEGVRIEDETRININSEDYRVRPQVIGQTGGCDDDNMSNRSTVTHENGLARCVVCLDKIGDMVLLPCAHGSVCEECSVRIAQNRASGGAHCPHCRSDIDILVKIQQVEGEIARGLELRVPIARVAAR